MLKNYNSRIADTIRGYHKPIKRKYPGLITAIVFIVAVLFASPLRLPTPAAQAKSVKPATSASTETVHERFATFLAGDGFKSVLLLENFRQDVPIIVTPTLILSGGEVPLDPVTMAPHSAATVDLSAYLLAHGFPDKRGTVSIRYRFNSYGPVNAVVQSSDETHNLYLNSIAGTHEEFWSGTTFDAVIWAPDEGNQGFITITNTSSEPRTVHTSFLVNGHSEELPATEVAPRHTSVLQIDDLIARSRKTGAGIHVEYDEYPGDVLVEGQVFNKRTGFAKYIHFMNKALKYPTATIRTHFLLLGPQAAEDGFPANVSFRSVAAVRNLDTAPIQITPTIKFLQDGSVQTITLNPLSLGVNGTQILDLSKEQQAGRLPLELHQASLQLVPDNDQSRIVGELFNFSDRSGGYVVGPSFSSYPNRGTASIWRTYGTFQTTIMVENTAANEDEVSLKVFSDHGTYNKIFPISAGGLLKINLKELQQDAVPDKDGNLLVGTSGVLSIAGSHNGQSKLTFDKIIHSDDEADYVGLPPNACDYVTGIVLWVDYSSSQNPFPVMADWIWTQSGTQTQNSNGASSSPSNLIQISAGQAGDVATINFSPGSQGQSLLLGGPPTTGGPDCDACSYGNFDPQGSSAVPPYAQIASTTVSPTTIGATSSPTSATITVSVYHQNIASSSVPNPEVNVEVATASTSPNGITVTYSETSKTVSLSGASPATATFTVSAPSASGSVTIRASLASPSPAGSFAIMQPNPASDGQATLSTTTGTPLQITTGSLPNGHVGTAYSATIAVTGGQAPYTWSNVGSLPPPLTLNPSNGAITGTPNQAGTFSFTVNVKDSSAQAQTATANFSITIQ